MLLPDVGQGTCGPPGRDCWELVCSASCSLCVRTHFSLFWSLCQKISGSVPMALVAPAYNSPGQPGWLDADTAWRMQGTPGQASMEVRFLGKSRSVEVSWPSASGLWTGSTAWCCAGVRWNNTTCSPDVHKVKERRPGPTFPPGHDPGGSGPPTRPCLPPALSQGPSTL